MHSNNILITGGAGYIGASCAYYFLKNTSCNVFIIDDFSTGYMENIKALDDFKHKIKLYTSSVGDKNTLEEVFSHDIDCVLHYAGSLLVSESTEKPIQYYKNNVTNMITLLEMCDKYKVPRLIFSSSATIYGEPLYTPIDESHQISPINPYGNTKQIGEKLLSDYANSTNNFEFVTLRYFNVAGSLINNGINIGQRGIATHLIKIASQCAIGYKEAIDIFGNDYNTKDGTCIRDYISIQDLALAHIKAYEYLKNGGKSDAFNVGYGRGYSVKEILNITKKVSNTNFTCNIKPRRNGDPSILVANNAKIREKMGWKAKFDNIEEIIKSAYEFEKMLNGDLKK
ncbi:UDP-glucose 4-epimerase GalE [Helicobacter sp. WB40]|uniref:UDP-glucose 4-epimerase GalE n=1 Tax=Helicobacter sp. WB40 TaxID=3004130 RepID=UPI0022EBEC77|nr:UDP-glucose 4-epimerase GalE [Helicobacter sp. WB40]MDA3967170.1 UDP-glucose 4-epimerase GalE [Helicobacter sp. WB40]